MVSTSTREPSTGGACLILDYRYSDQVGTPCTPPKVKK